VRTTAHATEVDARDLRRVIDKALDFPRKGTMPGGGTHPLTPGTWDGQSPCPFGWTATAVEIVAPTGTNQALPVLIALPDAEAALLTAPASQARLTGQERGKVTAALAGRADRDLKPYYPPDPPDLPRGVVAPRGKPA
jgi:hypothetical protein